MGGECVGEWLAGVGGWVLWPDYDCTEFTSLLNIWWAPETHIQALSPKSEFLLIFIHSISTFLAAKVKIMTCFPLSHMYF